MADYATPFAPDPGIEEVGNVRATVISNNFQTDPSQSEPVMRHPWAVRLETSVASRLSLEATLSDGIGLGTKAALVREADGPLDISLGFDELLFPTQKQLFGDAPKSGLAPSGRAWLGAAQTWAFVRVRAAVSMEPSSDDYHVVPHLAFETAFHLPFSIGWESRWESNTLRQDVGMSIDWSPFRLSGGLSEFQAWIFRNWTFGWYPSPSPGVSTGIDNPGWWVSVSLDIPNFPRKERKDPDRQATAPKPSTALDSQVLAEMAEAVRTRFMREELAELSVRARYSSSPFSMIILRKKILSGGPAARRTLWKIGLDTAVQLDERLQALVTLSDAMTLSDTTALDAVAKDPAPALRLESAADLGHLGGAASARILGKLAQDPDESVREAAKASLAGSDKGPPENAPAQKAPADGGPSDEPAGKK